ncbi:hypothetical protein MCECM63_01033 [Methylophilaceae bacterium]
MPQKNRPYKSKKADTMSAFFEFNEGLTPS